MSMLELKALSAVLSFTLSSAALGLPIVPWAAFRAEQCSKSTQVREPIKGIGFARACTGHCQRGEGPATRRPGRDQQQQGGVTGLGCGLLEVGDQHQQRGCRKCTNTPTSETKYEYKYAATWQRTEL
eukprot:1158820-Pelagomonas_calceolata.AAC.4